MPRSAARVSLVVAENLLDELTGARRTLVGWQLDLRIGRLSESVLRSEHSPGRSDCFNPILFESQVLGRSDLGRLRALANIAMIGLIAINMENLVDPFLQEQLVGRRLGILSFFILNLLHIVVSPENLLTELFSQGQLMLFKNYKILK